MRSRLQQALRRALCAGASGLAACQGHEQVPTATAPAAGSPPVVAAAPTPPLVAQRLGGQGGLWISLPATYALKTTDGPDFSVHYFAPADTTVRSRYTGGLYFGYNPQGSDSTAGCQRRRVTVAVLGRPVRFAVQRCATGYVVDAVFNGPSGPPLVINAFGEAKSADELRQLLAIFATLRLQQATPARPGPGAGPTK